MKYCSTRGGYGAAGKSFEDILFSAYAPDGGLYVPEQIPQVKMGDLRKLSQENATLPTVTAWVMEMYTGLPLETCTNMASAAFATFNGGKHPSLPFLEVDNKYFLETGNGPTLAFKDIGQQVVAQLLNYYLGKQNRCANVVVETSGDTGPAAVSAVSGLENLNIFCLYPHGRVSPVQELQLTTVDSPNVFVFATEGNTDEQAEALKMLFLDSEFMEAYNVCSINSINFGRIMAQSCYYFWAYLQARPNIDGPVDFVVPSGAFGNAMGGFLAKQMGLPIGKIVCATNANDIVHRTLSAGDMFMGENKKTISPAMDIQFAYNLERMLYFASKQNPEVVRGYMMELESNHRGVQLDELLVQQIKQTFTSMSISDGDTLLTMTRVFKEYSYALCPHSAIGVCAAEMMKADLAVNPVICVLTAHPAKFEETLAAAGIASTPHPVVEKLRKLPNDKFQWLRAHGKASREKIQEWSQVVKTVVSRANILPPPVRPVATSLLTFLRLDEIEGLVDKHYTTLIEKQIEGFKSFSQGRVEVAPVQHLDFGSNGDVCIKSGFIKNAKKFVVKCAGGFPGNAKLNKSTSSGLMMVFDQMTGDTDAILFDGGFLTDVRTAIAGAIAATKLAPQSGALKAIGIVGTGLQARFQLRWLRIVNIVAPVYVWGRSIEKREAYAKEMTAEGFEVTVCEQVEELCNNCNLIVTTTSARSAIVHDVLPGTHITAMGSDGLGKRELSKVLVEKADFRVADSRKQCLAFGELSCLPKSEHDSVRELGEVLLDPNGKYDRGGEDDQRITIFDSTGVAIQDVCIACGVLTAAR